MASREDIFKLMRDIPQNFADLPEEVSCHWHHLLKIPAQFAALTLPAAHDAHGGWPGCTCKAAGMQSCVT